MYRLFVAILFILMFSDPSWAGPLDQADRMFAAKKFQEGVRVLKKAVAKRDLAHEKRFEAGLELAGFYAQKVGDYPRAVSLGRKLIGNRKIIVDPSLASRAQTVLDQWLEQEKIWKDLNRDLRMMKAKTFQRKLLTDPSRAQELDRNGNRLKSILRDHPDFYRTHEVYYVLGLTRLIQDRPFRAWKAFARALELKPAMDLSQPVSKMIKDSASLWQKRFLRILACSVLGILMLVLCAAWIRSRPFQWFRARHLGGGTAVILLWVLVFHLSVNQSRDLENAKDLINSDSRVCEAAGSGTQAPAWHAFSAIAIV